MRFLVLVCILLPGAAAQSDVCGIATKNNRIVGGQEAPDGAWPWQVSIHHRGGHICGGSLINNMWVLSAAHCMSGDASEHTVFIGRQSQEGPNPNEVSRTITQFINHPDYDDDTNDNDMSLLKMSSSVTFTDYIKPVCLAASSSALHSGTDTWITGWGTIGSGVPLPSPQNLMEVEVPIVGNRQCFCNYNPNYITITDNMLCAGLSQGGKDSCQGDSGGPLVSKQDGRWIQAGVVSFGSGCAQPNLPGVYARVSRYEAWINNHITANQPGFIAFSSSGTDSDQNVTCSGLGPAVTAAPTTPAPVVCGRAPLNSRSTGMWPWTASVQKNQVHVCGAALVSEDSVLSDGSCFSSLDVTGWSVVLGGSNAQRVSVSNISVSNSGAAAVAVLRLVSKPSLSNYIQPICIDGPRFDPGTLCYRTQVRGEQTLQEFQTSVLSCGDGSSSDDLCTEVFTLDQGDLGSPLMCKVEGSWFQAVVLSNSTSRNRVQVQTFTKLSSYKSFLTSTVGPLLSPASSATAAPAATAAPTTATATSTAPLLLSHLLFSLLLLLLWG